MDRDPGLRKVRSEETPCRETRLREIAEKVLNMARTELLLSLPFLNRALWQLALAPEEETGVAMDGVFLYYDPGYVLVRYREDPAYAMHLWLHVLIHGLFEHSYVSSEIDRETWDLACDLFAEAMIEGLNLDVLYSPVQGYRCQEIRRLRQGIHPFTAEKLYRKFLDERLSPEEFQEWKQLCFFDDHRLWYEKSRSAQEKTRQSTMTGSLLEESEETEGSAPSSRREAVRAIWKKLRMHMESDLLSCSKQMGERTADFLEALRAFGRKQMDYRDFLRKFAARSEVTQVSMEEFDYIYYTYGMELYKDTPLIEPLEYREDKKIREFVIVIDTSGSVRGELVQEFLKNTWSILKQRETFARKFHLHILQCDAQVKRDDVVTDQRSFDAYLEQAVFCGFGGTDFRPAFAYVDDLVRRHVFHDLKGLIYFTDGLGIYPEKRPGYLTAFLFVNDGYNTHVQAPPWAVSGMIDGDNLRIISGG